MFIYEVKPTQALLLKAGTAGGLAAYPNNQGRQQNNGMRLFPPMLTSPMQFLTI